MAIINSRTRLIATAPKLVLALLAALVLGPVMPGHAAPPAQGAPPTSGEEEGTPTNESCMECHGSPYLQMALPSGEVVSLTVDLDAYQASVHGQHGPEGYLCIRCHEDNAEYPHPEVEAATQRELDIALSTGCERCHPASFEDALDGVHLRALADGNTDAAVCGDCHTGHAVQRLTDDETGALLDDAHELIPTMCQQCHSEIYDEYASSVHGAGLTAGNPDVPTCTDCHGVHNISGPASDVMFRAQSPETCATCHADEELMAEYDISTDVFQTYVDDFHGTTVSLFQGDDPSALTAPVCGDCHGVHNIMAVESADSPVIKENLVTTCQKCHPDASANFSSAWLSHYKPNFKDTPLVAGVNLFYAILIPTVIGGMSVFVASDVRRISRSKKEHNHDDK